MNVHGIINGILIFVAALLVIGQVIKKLGGSGAPAPSPGAGVPVRPAAKTTPRRPALVTGTPRSLPVAAVPRQARDDMQLGAADAFPVLDLTLPDADAPAGAIVQPRRAGRTFRGNVMPGERGWGANAVVALEILGPPVSLRSGATLGAPHAF
jgi:hypothetical protein